MRFIIQGEKPLEGEILLSGSTNSALALISASLLSSENVILRNIPNVGFVNKLLKVVRMLGVDISSDNLKYIINPNSFTANSFSIRDASQLPLLGPLVARGCTVKVPRSLGKIDGFRFLEKLGVTLKAAKGSYIFKCPVLKGNTIHLEAPSCINTTVAILASALAPGTTVLNNVSERPEIDDLISYLNEMGAKITRSVSNERQLIINGVRELFTADHTVIPNYTEAVILSVCAGFTSGYITVQNVIPAHLTAFLAKLEVLGINYEVSSSNTLKVWNSSSGRIIPLDITPTWYPGFVDEWVSPFAVLLTKADGESVVTGKNLRFAKELNRMGAKIDLQKNLIKVHGITNLKGQKFEAADLNTAVALITAALGAAGKSYISGIECLDDVYEGLDLKLQALGAKVYRS